MWSVLPYPPAGWLSICKRRRALLTCCKSSRVDSQLSSLSTLRETVTFPFNGVPCYRYHWFGIVVAGHNSLRVLLSRLEPARMSASRPLPIAREAIDHDYSPSTIQIDSTLEPVARVKKCCSFVSNSDAYAIQRVNVGYNLEESCLNMILISRARDDRH